MKESLRLMALSLAMAMAACVALSLAKADEPGCSEKSKPFGLDKVVAFYGDPKDIMSASFVLSDDWRYWKERGGVAAVSRTWFPLLQNTVDKGSDVLVNLNYRGNPEPVACIDEFGFDYDGQIDLKTAALLRATKEKKPELRIAVWQMRGPAAPVLATTYRELVDLVLMETYVDLKDSWKIAFQLQAARLNGLLEKSIVGLGIGQEAEQLGGWPWTRTAEELEQQVRLIRFVAPESPGVAFFGHWNISKFSLTAQELDEICGRFLEIPTDGTGLEPELLELGKTFTRRYEKTAIFCSSAYVQPNYYPGHPGPDGEWTNFGELVEPWSFRALTMNLGATDAKDVIVRLRNPGEDGEVWAKGVVDIPARSVTVAILPVIPGRKWQGWDGRWKMEVEAPGSEVFIFHDSRYWQ